MFSLCSLTLLLGGFASITSSFNSEDIKAKSNIPPLTAPTYCKPELDCSSKDKITRVVFKNIDNSSDCGNQGYNDYSSLAAAQVTAGNSYPISVWVGDGWDYETVSVWIDYNNNGVFEQDEFTLVGTGSGSEVSGSINIPSQVITGLKRMRVRVAAVGAAHAAWNLACDDTDKFGETEDYTVNISGGLPISLLSFKAQAVGKQAVLQWQTASEQNNDKFLIYRSGEDGVFNQIGEQTGFGNSTIIKNYTFYDKLPLNGINYYRLIQVDHDGKSAKVGESSVTFEIPSKQSLSIYPNPATSKVTLRFAPGSSHSELVDLNGKVIQKRNLKASDIEATISVDKLVSGIYLIKVSTTKGIIVDKLIKL